MAKRNKKITKADAAGALGGLITADLIGEVLAKTVGQFLSDGSRPLFGGKKKRKTEARREDLGLKLLAVVEEKELVRVPKLVRQVKGPLLGVLGALARLREFGLIEVEDRETVRLTESGRETLRALRKDAEPAVEELRRG